MTWRSLHKKVDTPLRLTEGPVFKIVDKDATDGKALIEMPAATLMTLLQLSRNWNQNSSLEIEDPLYYVKDNVSKQKKNWLSSLRWLSMGLRPLPVPTEWASPYGKDLVLNFTAKDVSSFQMIWLRNDEKPADPPFGIKEIGPEGGMVELPGVGKLEIPTGALDGPQNIRLQQVTEIKFPDSEEVALISPILKIDPENLALKIPAKLQIEYNPNQFRDGFPSDRIYYLMKDSSHSEGWSRTSTLIEPDENGNISFSYFHPTVIEKLSTFMVFAYKHVLKG